MIPAVVDACDGVGGCREEGWSGWSSGGDV